MSDYLCADDRPLLERHGLASFDALWALALEAVDAPNRAGHGWSQVFRLTLDGQGYYLKRQSDYLMRSLRHPFGEPSFAREFRNIQRYRGLGIPALRAAFFGQRRADGERRAILLTRALDDRQDLQHWLDGWQQRPVQQRRALVAAVGRLARALHEAGQSHGCFYPKHIFLREADGFDACLIDLEKTRPLRRGEGDRVRDLEPLLRRAAVWQETDVRGFLAAYLHRPEQSAEVSHWLPLLDARQRRKEARR
jgi:tRNA A-37 threonylcarbamoyl transferase component Bud32